MFQPYEFYRTHSVKGHKHLSQSMKFIRSSIPLIRISKSARYTKPIFLQFSQGTKSRKCTSRIWKSVVIGLRKFRLVGEHFVPRADHPELSIRGAGQKDRSSGNENAPPRAGIYVDQSQRTSRFWDSGVHFRPLGPHLHEAN